MMFISRMNYKRNKNGNTDEVHKSNEQQNDPSQ